MPISDIMSVLASSYRAASVTNVSHSKYVNVDPKAFQGTWSGKYANNQAYTVAISDVSGFHAKVKYQSGSTVLYQDVLIRDNAFRIGDSKFTLVRPGVAQIKTVMTDPASGASTLETSYANQG